MSHSVSLRGTRTRYGKICLLALLVLSAPVFLSAAPGDLLSVEFEIRLEPEDVDAFIAELFAGYRAPQAKFAVETYIITYESRYADGEESVNTAQLLVPQVARAAQIPVYWFNPGSTGIVDACAVTMEHTTPIRWGNYRGHTLAMAGQGLVGVVPDYPGFGDPSRLQQYYHAESEAFAVLDGLRALRSALSQLDGGPEPSGIYLGGYSQGGHAAFAAADWRTRYAPNVRIDGIVGFGPAADVPAVIEEYMVASPLLMHVYGTIYGEDIFDLSRIYQAQWAETMVYDITRQCIRGLQRYYPWSVPDLFSPEFARALQRDSLAKDFPEIHRILAANSTGLTGHGVPAIVLQGTNDIVVYPPTQDRFVTALRERGSDVTYRVFQGARHDTRQIGFFDALNWIQQRERELKS